jgi:hypothetical protein
MAFRGSTKPMNTRVWKVAAFPLALGGCGDPHTCWRMEVGSSYEVIVHEVLTEVDGYPELAASACPTGQDLDPDSASRRATFLVVGEDRSSEDISGCGDAEAEATGLPQVRLLGAAADYSRPSLEGPGFQVFRGSAQVALDDCEGDWNFNISGVGTQDGNPFGPYDPDRPKLLFNRCFSPSGSSTCASSVECCDRFGIELRGIED